VDKNPRATAGL